MKSKVVIIGAGNIGSAIAKVIRAQGGGVELWDVDTRKVPAQKPLAEIVPAAGVIFLCIPSWTIRAALIDLLPYLSKTVVIVSLAKGMEEGGKTIDHIFADMLSRRQATAVLGGPMLAAEIMQGLPTTGLLACNSRKTFEKVRAFFRGSHLHLEYSSDLHGTALAGILKNVYAVGMGIIEALEFGANAKGWYLVHAVREMGEIIKVLGGKSASTYGLAGLGDLVTTGLSPHSRNRTVGETLIKTGVCKSSEGCAALMPLAHILGKRANSFLLFKTMQAVIVDQAEPRATFLKLFERLFPHE